MRASTNTDAGGKALDRSQRDFSWRLKLAVRSQNMLQETKSKLTAWAPILEPTSETARLAREAVDAIAQSVRSKDFVIGDSARRRYRRYEDALLFAYLACTREDAVWADRATESLNVAVDQASQGIAYLGLFGGLAGLGWTLEHVSRLLENVCTTSEDLAEFNGEERIEQDQDDLNADVDMAILRNLDHFNSSRCFDLISGLVGFGTYFFERWPRESAAEGIRTVFVRLEELAQASEAGISWYSGPELLPEWQRTECPDGYYNLGVAHGIPGIIHFLSQVSTTTIIEPSRSSRLLEGAVDWLISQQRPREKRSRFSAWVVPGKEQDDSRLAWCYGDLGVLAVLLQVTRLHPKSKWKEFTQELLNQCLSWPAEQTGIGDAPLCHGAVGLAHIFNRIYQSERDTRCRDAALTWYDRTLAMRKPDGGVGGFFALTRPDPQAPMIWESSPAFLDGAVGLALALLAAITPAEPQWDRLLLLSSVELGQSL